MAEQNTKKAHEVTFAYLKRWTTADERGSPGVWVFDIPRQKLRFSQEAGRHTFAVETNLYMALIKGARDQSVEKWFSEMEGAFVSVLNRVRNLESSPPSSMEFSLAVMCAVALGYRSGFEVKEVERLFREEPRFKALLGENDDAHLAAVENMVNVISQQADRYRKATFLHGLAAPLVICDRPLLVLPSGDGALLPLGPTEVLKLDEAPGAREFVTDFARAGSESAGLAKTINEITVGRARKWVASQSKELLVSLQPLLTLDAVEARRRNDSVEYTPPEKLGRRDWWEIRRKV